MNKKKALLVTLDYPPNKGGVARYYGELAKRLPEIQVLTQAAQSEVDDDIRVHRKLLLWNYPLVWPKWLPLLRGMQSLVSEQKIDLVLAGEVLPTGTAARITKNRMGTPYAVFTHGLDILAPKGRKKKLMIKTLKQAKFVVANSCFTRSALLGLGVDKDKIVIVYPCAKAPQAPSENAIEDLRKKHDLQGKKVLLTVGRLMRRKGVDKVIESLPRIAEKVPDVTFVIVGGGPDQAYLKDLTEKHKMAGRVIFAGMPEDDELAAWYGLSDVFIMPARQIDGDVEGFGIVYLEANLRGLPVIAGRSGGAVEAIEDGKSGLVVDPQSTEEIVEASIRLLTDGELASRLGQQGKKRAEEEFDWDEQAAVLDKWMQADKAMPRDTSLNTCM